MLIQKTGLTKKTRNLLLVLGVVILGGGYFVYSSFYSTPSTSSNDTTTVVNIVSPTVVSTFDDSIFSDAQLFSLDRNPAAGFVDQHTGIVLDEDEPLPPVNVSVANPAVGKKLFISWEAPQFDNYSTFNIYRSPSQGSLGELVASVEKVDGTKIYSYQDMELTNGASYFYLVRSANAEGAESTNTLQIGSIVTDELPPLAPSHVAVTAVDEGIEVTWQLPVASDVAIVRIYRSSLRGVLGTLLAEGVGQLQTDAQATYTFTDTTVATNTEYYYTVTSVDEVGNESSRDILTAPVTANPFEPIVF